MENGREGREESYDTGGGSTGIVVSVFLVFYFFQHLTAASIQSIGIGTGRHWPPT